MLDAVTGVSGSGPAYFFYIVKYMIRAAMEMGFEVEVAETLVRQTMLGSYHLIENSNKTIDELIKAVASKGGTTEAAFGVFEEKKIGEGLIQGMIKAKDRARELSGA